MAAHLLLQGKKKIFVFEELERKKSLYHKQLLTLFQETEKERTKALTYIRYLWVEKQTTTK